MKLLLFISETQKSTRKHWLIYKFCCWKIVRPKIVYLGLQKATGHIHITSGQKYSACTKYSELHYPRPLARQSQNNIFSWHYTSLRRSLTSDFMLKIMFRRLIVSILSCNRPTRHLTRRISFAIPSCLGVNWPLNVLDRKRVNQLKLRERKRAWVIHYAGCNLFP